MNLSQLGTDLAETIKHSSTMFKSVSAIVVTFASFAVALWYLDNYVAHATDVEALKVEQKADVEALKVEQKAIVKEFSMKVDRSADMQRKKYLEDKIFEYDQVPENRRTQAEKAINNRNKAEVEELRRKWNRVP